MPAMTSRFWATLGLIIALCAAALVIGCGTPSRGARTSSRFAAGLGQGPDPQALRADLAKFVDLYSAVVAGAMGEIAAQTQDRRVREYAFLVRARQVPRARAALLDEDPREAFVRVWAQVAYNRYWSGRGSYGRVFHEFAPMLEEASATLDEAMNDLALRHFPEEAVLETRERLESAIRTLPPGSDLSPSTEIIAAARSAEGNPLSILLVPLRPLTGVNDAADSIAALAQVAQSALQFVKELPLMLRWQAEMLLFEFDDMETMVALREESGRLSVQLASLNATANELPQRVREETEILLNTADAATQRLGQALVETRRATEEINTALVQAERVSDSLRSTSQAVTSTMDATRGVLGDLEKLRAVQGERSADAEPLDLAEVTRLAQSLERAVSEARALLADVGRPLAPDSGVHQTMDRASVELRDLLNAMLWRGAALIGLAFLAALAYHAITRTRAPVGGPPPSRAT